MWTALPPLPPPCAVPPRLSSSLYLNACRPLATSMELRQDPSGLPVGRAPPARHKTAAWGRGPCRAPTRCILWHALPPQVPDNQGAERLLIAIFENNYDLCARNNLHVIEELIVMLCNTSSVLRPCIQCLQVDPCLHTWEGIGGAGALEWMAIQPF